MFELPLEFRLSYPKPAEDEIRGAAQFDRRTVKCTYADVVPPSIEACIVLFDGKPLALGESLSAANGVTLMRKC